MQNKVVEFNYYGGLNPGSLRRIFVLKITERFISGIDLETDSYVDLIRHKTKNINTMSDSVVVDMTTADNDLKKSIVTASKKAGYNVLEINDFMVAWKVPNTTAVVTVYSKEQHNSKSTLLGNVMVSIDANRIDEFLDKILEVSKSF